MELQSLIYLFIGVSFTIYFGLAMWTKASSTKDFYIVQNTFNPLFKGASIAGDFISAFSFLSLSGIFFTYGYESFIYIFSLLIGFILLILITAPNLRKNASFSIPNFLEKQYESDFIKYLTIFIVILISSLFISAQIKGLGIVFARIFHLELFLALVLGFFISLLYALIGGIKNTNYTQLAQYIIILFAFMTPSIFLSLEFTNSFLPQTAFFSQISINIAENVPSNITLIEAFEKVLQDLSFQTFLSFSPLNTLLISSSLIFGLAVLPHILMRFFSSPSIQDAKKSGFWALIFISILYTSLSSLFVFSSFNITKNIKNIEYEAFINDEAKDFNDSAINGRWLNIWEDTTLVKFEDSNKNGIIDINKGEKLFNELSIDPDAIFLINSELANLPNWVIALVLAGAISATLSTMSALILNLKISIFNELLEKSSKTSSQKSLITKILIFCIILFSFFLTFLELTIFQFVALAFTICTATIFPTLALSIFYKKLSKKASILGILSGFIFTIVFIVFYLLTNNLEENLYIRMEGIGSIGASINFLISIFASKIYKNDKINKAFIKEEKEKK